MARPTIKDLAAAADLSVSTVNRVLGGHATVREITIQQVLAAAEKIGFYGVHAIEDRLRAKKPRHRFGILLQESRADFYRTIGETFREAAKNFQTARIELVISHMSDLSPESVAASMLKVGSEVDALAVVAAQHPLITDAISKLRAKNKPVFALISGMSSSSGAPYLGLDNWKVGRTAAWSIAHMAKREGEIAILVGNHRYRCQEMNEAGFRSYFREYAPNFRLLEPQSTYESDTIARDVTERILDQHPNLEAIYIAGGGIGGALEALRAKRASGRVVAVGHDYFAAVREGLLDGYLTMSLANNIELLAEKTVEALYQSVTSANLEKMDQILPFYTFTRESI